MGARSVERNLMARHEEVTVATLPACDFCKEKGVTMDAAYDGKTKGGPWANMCSLHFAVWGLGVGLGVGQRLVKS